MVASVERKTGSIIGERSEMISQGLLVDPPAIAKPVDERLRSVKIAKLRDECRNNRYLRIVYR